MTTPLLLRNHFQIAYVVRDAEKAIEAFGAKLGAPNWKIRQASPGAPAKRIALAHAGGVVLELVEPDPEQDTIFRSWIPDDPAAARFHHLGYYIENEAEWKKVVDAYHAAGIETMCGKLGDLLDYGYADTVAQLGHYVEIVLLHEAGKDFFTRAPHN